MWNFKLKRALWVEDLTHPSIESRRSTTLVPLARKCSPSRVYAPSGNVPADHQGQYDLTDLRQWTSLFIPPDVTTRALKCVPQKLCFDLDTVLRTSTNLRNQSSYVTRSS